jgi:hypothetical protein
MSNTSSPPEIKLDTDTSSPPEIKFDTKLIKEKIEYGKTIIEAMRKANNSDSEIEAFFFNNEIEFYQKYPYLIKKLIKNDNLDFLDKMIDNLEKVEQGEQTFASTELKLGKELADEYLPKQN